MATKVVSKRQGKAGKDGSGLKVYIKPEEAEQAGIKKGEKVDISVNPDGSITIRPAAPPNLYEKFLRDVVQGGVEFGEPIEMGDSHIIPVFAKETKAQRDHVTVPEALEKGWLRFTDTGNINGVHVTNTGNKGVLVVAGQVFEGQTQARTVITNMVLAPNQSVVLPSRCVHSTRMIEANAKMTLTGMAPRNVAFGLTAPQHKVDQHRIWGDVSCVMGTTCTVSSFFMNADVGIKQDSWQNTTDLTQAVHSLSNVADFVSARVDNNIKTTGGKKRVKYESE